jgi:hypothetical protein
MIKNFAIATFAVAALAGATFFATAEPAAAKDYEYCRQDWASGMRQCGFDTVEQCVAMISGRGGTCTRNPLYSEATAAYAYVPKAHTRHHR